MVETKQIDMAKLTKEELKEMLFMLIVDIQKMAGDSGRFILMTEGSRNTQRGWQMATNIGEEGKAEEIIRTLLARTPDLIEEKKIDLDSLYQSQKGEIN